MKLLLVYIALVSGKIRWFKIEARPDFKIYKYSFILKNQTYTSLMLTKYNKYASDSHRFLKRNARRWRLVSTFCCQALGLSGHLVNVADHVEGDLGKVIVLAGQDGLEARDCLVNGDQLARVVGENLSDLNNGIIRMRSNKEERWVTWKGWERNLSIFLALATFSLSSSDNSFIPRMAMMSWRDL